MIFRIALVFMILAGGFGVYVLTDMYLTFLEPKSGETLRQENGLKRTLIFSRPLQRGTRITSEDLKWQDRKEVDIPFDAYVEDMSPLASETLVDSYIAKDVLMGQFVLPPLIISGVAGFMALAIRPGMRALAVRTNSAQIAGGFIQPEDRVDVIQTFSRDFDGDGISSWTSRTILQNVRVLAVGKVASDRIVAKTTAEQTSSGKRVEGQKVIEAETITVELTDKQSQALISAGKTGEITFVLRPVGNPTLMPTLSDLSMPTENVVGAQPRLELPTVIDKRDEAVLTVAAPTTETPAPIKIEPLMPEAETFRVISVITPSGRTNVSVPFGDEK